MPKIQLGTRAEKLLTKLEGPIGSLQFLLSALAIFLVVANEFLPQSAGLQVPFLHWDWSSFRSTMQMVTWFVFVSVFVVYAAASGHILRYAREHWPELLICLTWIPFTEGVLLRQLHTLLSLQTLLLLGTIAHVIRVARWTSKRFSDHPVVVLCAAAAVLVTAGSALLMQVEPRTFTNFADSAWYVLMTMFTVGSSITPVTLTGRVVSAVVTVLGIGLGGVFIGTVSKLMSQRLFKSGGDANAKMQAQLEENTRLLKELLASRQTGQLPAAAAPDGPPAIGQEQVMVDTQTQPAPVVQHCGADGVATKVIIGNRLFGRELEVPSEACDKDFWQMVVRYQFLYSVFGLCAGVVCVMLGLLLFVLGITDSAGSADFLGFHINDAAPGVVLFTVGVALAQITQFSVKIVPEPAPPAPPADH